MPSVISVLINRDKDDELAAQISFKDIEVVEGKNVAMKGEEIKKVTVKKLRRLCVKKNITGYRKKEQGTALWINC